MKSKGFTILALMILALLFAVSGMQAQDEVECGLEICDTTVILVVDAFITARDLEAGDVSSRGTTHLIQTEPNSRYVSILNPLIISALQDEDEPEDESNFAVEAEALPQDEFCVISPDGQDGAGFDGSPPIVTSSFHPFRKTHGEYVFTLLQHLLEANGGSRVGQFLTPLGNVSWMPIVELWSYPTSDKNILLIAVDTNGYTSTLIEQRIEQAFNLLNIPDTTLSSTPQLFNLETGIGDVMIASVPEFGGDFTEHLRIQDVVINMSFALIPCGDIPTMSLDDYIEQAGVTTSIDFTASPNDWVEQISNDVKDEGGAKDFYVDNISPQYTDINASTFDAYGPNGNLAPFQWVDPDLVLRDPLVTFLLERCADPIVPADQEPVRRTCIPVASAGNADAPFPFAPAIINGVLSVKADYSRIDGAKCDHLMSQDGNIVPDLTNEGAYLHDGVMYLATDADLPSFANFDDYNVDGLIKCLYGTSFSAPRISFAAAVLPYNESRPIVIDAINDRQLNYDHDGDGIGDMDEPDDACPAEGVRVDAEGCPVSN